MRCFRRSWCHVSNAKCDVQNRFHHRHSFQRLLQETLKTGRQHFGMIVTLRIIILRNFIMRFLGQDQSFLDPTFIQTYRYYIWTHMWFSNSSLPKNCKLEHPILIHYIPIYIYINSSIFHCIPVKSVQKITDGLIPTKSPYVTRNKSVTNGHAWGGRT